MTETFTKTRPVLRYHGGKWMLAPWIIRHFPVHRVYTEAFGGAASVLLRKPRAYSEVYNDLDSEVVSLFRLLRDPVRAEELAVALRFTPFAREEFEQAYTEPDAGDDMERARRLIIRAFMGFGSAGHNAEHRTGFRANSNRSGTTPAHDWANYPANLPWIVDRLRGVVIENRPAADILRQHDGAETLHYVDPPYPLGTRYNGERTHCYRHEMSDTQHCELAEVLRSLSGMVVLSGYPCDLYDAALYPDWKRVTRAAFAGGAAKRTEVLWLNGTAAKRLAQEVLL